MDGQGNLERTSKVREKSGNLKIHGFGRQTEAVFRKFNYTWLWQAVFRKFNYLVQEGKGCTFSCDCLSPSPSSLGATLKEKNLLPWGANVFL